MNDTIFKRTLNYDNFDETDYLAAKLPALEAL